MCSFTSFLRPTWDFLPYRTQHVLPQQPFVFLFIFFSRERIPHYRRLKVGWFQRRADIFQDSRGEGTKERKKGRSQAKTKGVRRRSVEASYGCCSLCSAPPKKKKEPPANSAEPVNTTSHTPGQQPVFNGSTRPACVRAKKQKAQNSQQSSVWLDPTSCYPGNVPSMLHQQSPWRPTGSRNGGGPLSVLTGYSALATRQAETLLAGGGKAGRRWTPASFKPRERERDCWSHSSWRCSSKQFKLRLAVWEESDSLTPI